jgi:hypothetical protein
VWARCLFFLLKLRASKREPAKKKKEEGYGYGDPIYPQDVNYIVYRSKVKKILACADLWPYTGEGNPPDSRLQP